MRNIDRILFDAQEYDGTWIESYCGMHVGQQDIHPHIHLFEIEENGGAPVGSHLAQACMAIRDQVFPDLELNAINWRLTKGMYDSEVEFDVVNGWPILMKIDPNMDFGKFHKYPLSFYQRGLNQFSDFDDYLRSIPSYPRSDFKQKIAIVPLPEHPRGFCYLKEIFAVPHMHEDYQVVLADSQKFLDHWNGQSHSFEDFRKAVGFSVDQAMREKWETGYDPILFISSKEKSIEYAKQGGSTDSMIEMPYVSFSVKGDKISFSNGRHRAFNLINLGAPFVPLQMAVSERTHAFSEKFSWQPDLGNNVVQNIVFSASLDREF